MSDEKSGLEMIEEILELVQTLNKRSEVTDQLLKELLNRANNNFAISSKPQTDTGKGPSIVGTEPNVTDMNAMSAGAMKAATNTTKVMGKIRTKDGKALIGANVTVVNNQGEVVKQTKTNRAGDWMCFLPVGMYKARYFMDKIINATVTFNITPDQTLIRVAQPKWE